MSPGGSPAMSHSTGQSNKAKAHLDRVRDNQRRSRARRKEYLNELEDKFRRCEQLGVEASSEMQAAALRVLEENARLRAFLREKGVSDIEMDEYTGTSASHDDELMGSAITTKLSTPTHTIGRSGARRPSAPIQGLTTLLTTRKPCCPTRPGSQDPIIMPRSGSANSSQDDDYAVTAQASSTNENTTQISNRSDPSMSMLQPIQTHLQGRSPSQTDTQPSDVVSGFQTSGIIPQEDVTQARWQQHQQRLQAQQLQMRQRMPQAQSQSISRHSHTPSYASEATSSYPLNPSSYPTYSPTFVPPMNDPSIDMSNLLPLDIQAQFLRGLDSNNTSYNPMLPPQNQRHHQTHPAGAISTYTGMDDLSGEFKLEDDTAAAFPTDWPNFQGPAGWSSTPQPGSGQQGGGHQWGHMQ